VPAVSTVRRKRAPTTGPVQLELIRRTYLSARAEVYVKDLSEMAAARALVARGVFARLGPHSRTFVRLSTID
jgi:hypothetical protein